jgi:hypothetical protein
LQVQVLPRTPNFEGRERDWYIAYPVTIRVLGSIPATPAILSTRKNFVIFFNFFVVLVKLYDTYLWR